MTRIDFAAFLEKHQLGMPLQTEGACAGLPVELTEALHVADVARELGLSVPTSDEIRSWYSRTDSDESAPPPALHAFKSLTRLYADDLGALDLGELLLFATTCANWADAARAALQDRRAQKLAA